MNRSFGDSHDKSLAILCVLQNADFNTQTTLIFVFLKYIANHMRPFSINFKDKIAIHFSFKNLQS